MADERKLPSEDDKSINDLLKEYAEDVKEKDIDDFLKESDDEEEDSFDSDDDSAEEESEKVLAAQGQPRRKGAGLLTMVFIVVAFGAAGAGAYMYLNRDSGMTSIMGGFGGGDADQTSVAMAPPAIDDAPRLPMDSPIPSPDAAASSEPALTGQPELDQPSPITNDSAANDNAMPADVTAAAPELTGVPSADVTAPDVTAPDVTAVAPAPGADLIALPDAKSADASAKLETAPAATAPAQQLAPIEDVPAPADAAGAAQAVDAWASGTVTPSMPGPDGAGNTAPTLPEQQVGEMKAKPPVTKKAKAAETKIEKMAETKAEKPKAEAAKAEAPLALVPADTMDEPATAFSEPAAIKAPRPAARDNSADAALPPPYLDIQARKSGEGAVAATPRRNRDTQGNVNSNVADVTKSTGQTAALVASGGGVVDLGGGASAPVAVPAASYTASVPADTATMRSVPLAINGGRSLPAGAVDGGVVQTRAYAQLPTAQGAQPSAPAAPSMPAYAAPTAPAAPAPVAVPAATGGANNAAAILAQAQAAERSGNASSALGLYQKALEVDAVYGDGRSIDRGAVYDRIGALRAGR